MSNFVLNSSFFSVSLCIFAYQIALNIKRKLKFSIFNPFLMSSLVVIFFLKMFDVPYENFKTTSSIFSFFITPISVCLAVPLYEQLELLKNNYLAIFMGIFCGVISGLISVFVIAYGFGLDHKLYVALLPKSVTMAIGLPLADEYGADSSITAAVILLTGVVGSTCASLVFKIFRIKRPIAMGVALGVSAHVIGTARAIELGNTQGAMASLALAVSGLISVFAIGFFANLL